MLSFFILLFDIIIIYENKIKIINHAYKTCDGSDPDGCGSRSVIEGVKMLLSLCCESSRYASSSARYCSYIVEVRHLFN